MGTKKRNKGREIKPMHRDNFSVFDADGNYVKSEDQQFVVPWQLVKTKEKEILTK